MTHDEVSVLTGNLPYDRGLSGRGRDLSVARRQDVTLPASVTRTGRKQDSSENSSARATAGASPDESRKEKVPPRAQEREEGDSVSASLRVQQTLKPPPPDSNFTI